MTSETAVTIIRELEDRLFSGAGIRPLAVVLDGLPGWTLTNTGQWTRVNVPPINAVRRHYTQFTVGMPLASLAYLHQVAAGLPARPGADLVALNDFGARVGDEAAMAFLRQATMRNDLTDRHALPFLRFLAGVDEVRSYVSITSIHMVALFYGVLLMEEKFLRKNALVTALRTDFVDLLRQLGPREREFIAGHANQWRNDVVAQLSEINDGVRDLLADPQVVDEHLFAMAYRGEQPPGAPRTVRDAFDYATSGDPARRVSLETMVDMKTRPMPPAPVAQGTQGMGLALVELRHWLDATLSAEDFSYSMDLLREAARRGYDHAVSVWNAPQPSPEHLDVLGSPLVTALRDVFRHSAGLAVNPGNPQWAVRPLLSRVERDAMGLAVAHSLRTGSEPPTWVAQRLGDLLYTIETSPSGLGGRSGYGEVHASAQAALRQFSEKNPEWVLGRLNEYLADEHAAFLVAHIDDGAGQEPWSMVINFYMRGDVDAAVSYTEWVMQKNGVGLLPPTFHDDVKNAVWQQHGAMSPPLSESEISDAVYAARKQGAATMSVEDVVAVVMARRRIGAVLEARGEVKLTLGELSGRWGLRLSEFADAEQMAKQVIRSRRVRLQFPPTPGGPDVHLR